MSRRANPSFTEAQVRKLLRAARAEGWNEVRLATPAGEVTLSSGAPAAARVAPDIDAELEAFDRGEL